MHSSLNILAHIDWTFTISVNINYFNFTFSKAPILTKLSDDIWLHDTLVYREKNNPIHHLLDSGYAEILCLLNRALNIEATGLVVRSDKSFMMLKLCFHINSILFL